MAEGLKIEDAGGGIYVYRVYDPRSTREVVAGYYDENTRIFHKFADKVNQVQHKVNGQWLEGFGIQENVFTHLRDVRKCDAICVHYAPSGLMYTARLGMWSSIGLLATYAGLQRFLGIMTLPVTKKMKEAEMGKTPPLSVAELRELTRSGQQMTRVPDIIPGWFTAEA